MSQRKRFSMGLDVDFHARLVAEAKKRAESEGNADFTVAKLIEEKLVLLYETGEALPSTKSAPQRDGAPDFDPSAFVGAIESLGSDIDLLRLGLARTLTAILTASAYDRDAHPDVRVRRGLTVKESFDFVRAVFRVNGGGRP